ncbi:MAG: Smr/MutS family protein [Desulfobacteraceae bacterium]|nr:Smr/MutS family protein [Desulfobacteraceae bacterium]
MASPPSETFFRPFEDLKLRLKDKKFQLPRERATKTPTPPAPPLSAQEEALLFSQAMADVTPLFFNRHWHPSQQRRPSDESIGNADSLATEALDRLIHDGLGFVVANTSEFMEATGPGVSREIARRLHQGRYAIEDHVDLHGLTAAQADEAVHRFLRKAIRDGKRAVLLVHGRGLSSPGQPVLKNKVYEWLTRGPLRKHVIALTSARSCDGGSGATYVLLRRRPMTKRMRKAAFSEKRSMINLNCI